MTAEGLVGITVVTNIALDAFAPTIALNVSGSCFYQFSTTSKCAVPNWKRTLHRGALFKHRAIHNRQFVALVLSVVLYLAKM